MPTPPRAVLFIDGNNWYHGLKAIGVGAVGRLSYPRIARKLIGARELLGIRYYIGQMSQAIDPEMFATQRRFLHALRASDPRVTTHLGRLESRPAQSSFGAEP